MITVILINVLFSALVVVGLVGGLAYGIVADRRHLRTFDYHVRQKPSPGSPGVAATSQLAGSNA